MSLAQDGDWDLLIVSLRLGGGDGLRVCSQMRAVDRLHDAPVVLGVTRMTVYNQHDEPVMRQIGTNFQPTRAGSV